jgi:hypothetical protein
MFKGLKEEGDDKWYLCYYIIKFYESTCFNTIWLLHLSKNMILQQKKKGSETILKVN